ncbi:MAG: choice-of-anchor L domain-containing protein [Phycisphaerales bacterium]|nr:choice-of-anchor L domain-containing protein [Phycisphaerales bacterium]
MCEKPDSTSEEWQRHRVGIGTGLLLCALLVASAHAADAPRRPQVGPGGSNWKPPAQPASRALTTHDLASGLTPADVVNALLGPGVAASQIQFSGALTAAGTFSGGTGIVGFESGIILSSGNIGFVPGPNSMDDVTADNGLAGDADLDGLIPGYETFDACILEFDFVCDGPQTVVFRYVLTSEEYNEWVASPYNDVFGFFLNGQNIALVPGSGGMAVSINNVNCSNPYNPPDGSFCNLYVNNDCSDIPPGTFPCAGVRDIEMDGFTVVLTATGTLQAGTNHIKLAVADAGDRVLDSNVFIQGQSFSCGTPVGACCHTGTLTCDDYMPQSACQEPGDVWSVGLFCDQLNPPCVQVQHQGGEDCQHAIAIGALPFVDVNSTCTMDNDYSSTCLGTFDNGDDIIYALQLSSPLSINITVAGATPADNWIGVAVGDTCPPGEPCIAYATTSGTVATITDLALPAGTYYLMIDRWPSALNCMDFTLTITSGAPTGACCHTTAQLCDENVPQADCQAPGDVWSMGLACSQLIPPCTTPPQGVGRDCEYPLVVNGLPYANVNTTCDKHEDYSNTCLGNYDNGDDIIYELHVAVPQTVAITVSGATPNDRRIGVALGSTCPPGQNCIAMATTEGTVATIPSVSLAPGVYYLMIDCRPVDVECIAFSLSITTETGFGGMLDCLAGPDNWPTCPDPSGYDFDIDGDVDMGDFAMFQEGF